MAQRRPGTDTCAVCQEEPKDPRILPCGNDHVFCRDPCLKRLLDHHRRTAGTNSFPCPLCRNVVNVPKEGVNMLEPTVDPSRPPGVRMVLRTIDMEEQKQIYRDLRRRQLQQQKQWIKQQAEEQARAAQVPDPSGEAGKEGGEELTGDDPVTEERPEPLLENQIREATSREADSPDEEPPRAQQEANLLKQVQLLERQRKEKEKGVQEQICILREEQRQNANITETREATSREADSPDDDPPRAQQEANLLKQVQLLERQRKEKERTVQEQIRILREEQRQNAKITEEQIRLVENQQREGDRIVREQIKILQQQQRQNHHQPQQQHQHRQQQQQGLQPEQQNRPSGSRSQPPGQSPNNGTRVGILEVHHRDDDDEQELRLQLEIFAGLEQGQERQIHRPRRAQQHRRRHHHGNRVEGSEACVIL